MKKGITISMLAITITVMLILVSISTVVGISSIRTASYEEFLSKLTRVSNAVNLYIKANKELPVKNEIVSKTGLNSGLIKLLNNNGDELNELYVVDMEKITVESVNLGYGTTENMDVFLVAETTNNIYYLKGYKYKGNIYYGPEGKKTASTLGELVRSAADYGKTVNYEANGVTDWKVFYKTNDYVYLIASEPLDNNKIPTNIPGAIIGTNTVTIDSNTKKEIGTITWNTGSLDSAATIRNAPMWMASWPDYKTNENVKFISYFLDEDYWAAFKSKNSKYSSYVLGAIGTPTLEMFVASWNAKKEATKDTVKYDKTLSLVKDGTIRILNK